MSIPMERGRTRGGLAVQRERQTALSHYSRVGAFVTLELLLGGIKFGAAEKRWPVGWPGKTFD